MLLEILRRYGIEGATPRKVGAGNNNEHWYAGPYVLRRYRDRRPFATVVFEHAILDHLTVLGWPVAAPVAALGGERIIEVDDRLYAVFPRLPGRRGITERPRAPRELGRMLGRLHRDLATCRREPPSGTFREILSITTTWGTGSHTVDALFAAFAETSPGSAAYFTETLQGVRQEVAALDLSGMPRTLIHGDWHAGNLLYSRGEVTGVLDFDFAHPDLRIADIAVSATVIDDDVAVALIAGYRDEHELPVEELALLNLHERARLLGAVAATLSIRSRGGRVDTGLDVLVGMLRRLEARWPEMKTRLGLP
jgi:homoserine kinase type II